MSKANIKDALSLAEQLVAKLKSLNGAEEGEPEALEIPSPSDVAELEKGDVAKLAAQIGIDAEGIKPSALKALVTTAAAIIHDETDDIEDDAVVALADAVGVASKGKPAKVLSAVKAYLEAEKDSEESEEDAEESEDSEESEESEEEDSEESEEEDEEKPKKGKAKKKSDDEDAEEDGEDGEDAEESEDSEDSEEETESGDDDEEVSPKEKKSRLAKYNAVAKKPAKTYEAMLASFTDDDGDTHPWGEPYSKGEHGYCCGQKLRDVKHDGQPAGKCQVSGKVFVQDADGDLVEAE